MMPLISVIMPAYNSASFIHTAILSVQKQSFTNWELLIVDDGSSDNVQEIVGEFVQNDSRICLIVQENQGVSGARNQGIIFSKGKYLAFLDSDDAWEATFLEKLLDRAQSGSFDVIYSGYKKERKNHQYKQVGKPFRVDDLLLFYLLGKQGLHLSTFLIEKFFLDKRKVMFTRGCAYGEDIEFILKLLCFAQVCAVEEYLSLYKYQDNSAMNVAWNSHREEAILALERAYCFVEKNYSKNDREKVLKAFKQRIFFLLYRIVIDVIKIPDYNRVGTILDKYSYLIDFNQAPILKSFKMKMIFLREPKIWKLLNLILKK